ncbi:MAG: glucose-6-phosphate isomerase, partial [Bacilli bacterium]|nr:glucose-6-phosphate isomerase [Bacilli bacterium]
GNNNVVLELEEMNPFNLGYLFYFFERACAMSAYLNEVNPFNQPGVEIYKKNMFHLLGKPGF